MSSNTRIKSQKSSENKIQTYFQTYFTTLHSAALKVSPEEFQKALLLLEKTTRANKQVFVAGNGGSAAISNHLCCDWTKGGYDAQKKPLTTHSLVANSSMLTALANDFCYEESIAKQIEMMARPGDVLVLISSSGNSPNIIAALKRAKKMKIPVIGMSGFDGGELRKKADISLYVPAHNYGVIEDVHQSLMHIISQILAGKNPNFISQGARS